MDFVFGSVLDNDQEYQLELAKDYITEYCQDEFGDTDVDFNDLEHVGLAYTTIDNPELGVYDVELECQADLKHCKITYFVNGTPVDVREFSSLKELNDKYLSNLDWSLCAEPRVSEEDWLRIYEDDVRWHKELRQANKDAADDVSSVSRVNAAVRRKLEDTPDEVDEEDEEEIKFSNPTSLKDLLSDDPDLMMDVVHTIYSEAGEFESDVFLDADAFYETLSKEAPEDIVLKFFNGKDLDSKGPANPNREYFRLNKYANVESTNYPGDIYIDKILNDVCKYIEGKGKDIKYPEAVQDILDAAADDKD